MIYFSRIKRLIFIALFATVAGLSSNVFANADCPVDGTTFKCVPYQATPWRYLASLGNSGPGGWYSSPQDAYAALVAWVGKPCAYTVAPLGPFSPSSYWPDSVISAEVVFSVPQNCSTDPGRQFTAYVSGYRDVSCPAGSVMWTSNGSYTDRYVHCIVRAQQSPSLKISSSPPVIPANSTTQSGKVLTKSNLTLTVTQGGQPVSGMLVGLQSSRGSSMDAIHGPTAPTNANGTAVADVSTHAQPGQSTISAVSPSNLQTATPANINWLPARYESQFLVTCYVLALESEAPQTPVSTNVCGLPSSKRYRTEFLDAVKRQGSGQTLDGTIIHTNGHHNGQDCFNTDSCARTSTGACASVGTTIAVDPAVIPRRSAVSVDILGQRIAQDGGHWINGYHIDDYMGPVPHATCDALGRRHSGIVFQSY